MGTRQVKMPHGSIFFKRTDLAFFSETTVSQIVAFMEERIFEGPHSTSFPLTSSSQAIFRNN